MDPTDRVVLSMSAPFVPLLGQCLRLSGAVDVVTIATRCLCTLLTWGIQVEPKFVQAVGAFHHIAVSVPLPLYTFLLLFLPLLFSPLLHFPSLLFLISPLSLPSLLLPSSHSSSYFIIFSFSSLLLPHQILSSLNPPSSYCTGGRLLRLMLRSGALRSTDSELVQACIKGLTSLFALHNNRLAVRADTRMQMKERQAMREINDMMPDGQYISSSSPSSPLPPTSLFQLCKLILILSISYSFHQY